MEDKRKQMLNTLRAKALEQRAKRAEGSINIPSPRMKEMLEKMKAARTANPQAQPMKRMSREELIERIKKLKKVE